MKPRTVRVLCRGISPILMDQMTEETLDSLATSVRQNKPKDRPFADVAEEKIYRDPMTERIGIPSEMLFACLVAAGRKVKNGKSQISTATSSTVPDFLEIPDFFFPFLGIPENVEPRSEDERQHWKVDKRRGRLPINGTAVCLIRPRFNNWEFKVTVIYDADKIDGSTLKALFVNAGSGQGLGSFRPNCRGTFGKFVVVSWEETAGAVKEDETEETDVLAAA